MLNWFVKRIIIGKLNALMTGREKSLHETRSIVERWTGRIRIVLSLLSSISAKLADAKLTTEEIKALVEDLKSTVRDW